MSKDNIIEIARKAGLPIERDDEGEYIGYIGSFDRYELVRKIVEVERNECAKLVEDLGWTHFEELASAIRERNSN